MNVICRKSRDLIIIVYTSRTSRSRKSIENRLETQFEWDFRWTVTRFTAVEIVLYFFFGKIHSVDTTSTCTCKRCEQAASRNRRHCRNDIARGAFHDTRTANSHTTTCVWHEALSWIISNSINDQSKVFNRQVLRVSHSLMPFRVELFTHDNEQRAYTPVDHEPIRQQMACKRKIN